MQNPLYLPNQWALKKGPISKARFFTKEFVEIIRLEISGHLGCPLARWKWLQLSHFYCIATNAKSLTSPQPMSSQKGANLKSKIFYQGIGRNHQIGNIWTFRVPAGPLKMTTVGPFLLYSDKCKIPFTSPTNELSKRGQSKIQDFLPRNS